MLYTRTRIFVLAAGLICCFSINSCVEFTCKQSKFNKPSSSQPTEVSQLLIDFLWHSIKLPFFPNCLANRFKTNNLVEFHILRCKCISLHLLLWKNMKKIYEFFVHIFDTTCTINVHFSYSCCVRWEMKIVSITVILINSYAVCCAWLHYDWTASALNRDENR